MKKTLAAVLAVILLAVCLTGCETNSYSAVGLVTSNNGNTAFMSFISLTGTRTFKMKYDMNRQAQLTYSGKLGSGKATVSYKCNGTEYDLFTAEAGEDISSSLPLNEVLNSSSFVIIVKTDEKCEYGEFNFNVVYDR